MNILQSMFKSFSYGKVFRKSCLHGFTLTELLVVIIVVTILAVMLLPALGEAGKQDEAAKCMDNLRQVGKATVMYMEDHDEFIPFAWSRGGYLGGSSSQYIRAWFVNLAVYLNLWPHLHSPYDIYHLDQQAGPIVYTCPSQRFNYPHTRPVSYMPSIHLGHTAPHRPVINGQQHRTGRFPQLELGGNQSWVWDGWGLPGSTNTDFNRTNHSGFMESNRHEEGVNVLFFGGHVEWHHRSAILGGHIPEDEKGGLYDNLRGNNWR